MRRIRTAGLGIGLTVASAGWAADPPAARFGRIQPIEQTSPVTSRGQLGQPKAVPAGPTVTEQRGHATPPAAQLGTVTPGVQVPAAGTVVYGTPYVVGGPIPGTAVAPPPIPGGQCPPGGMACPDLDPPLCGPDGIGTAGPLGLLTGRWLGVSRVATGGPERLHLDADLLLWWVRSGNLPPLVTTSSPPFNGIIGQGDTRVLVGGVQGQTFHTGGRFGGVYWLGCDQRWGVDGNVFFLARRGRNDTFTTATDPLLARPFANLNQGLSFSEVVAAPGIAVGSVTVNGETQAWGAEVNARRYLTGDCGYRIDGLLGFRYFRFAEGVTITESFSRVPGSDLSLGVPNALFGTISDRFRTVNQFYGPQVGFAGEIRRGRFFAEGRTTVAFGTVRQDLQVDGQQSVQFTTGPGVFNGGLLALPGGNIGHYTQNKFGVLPEVGLKLGVFVTPNLKVGVGYNFLYLNSVLRPGEQIDPGLDVTRIPNFAVPGNPPPLFGVRPAPRMATTDVFAQGLSFSMTWTW